MGQALSLRQTLPGWLADSILYLSISSCLIPKLDIKRGEEKQDIKRGGEK